MSNLKETFDLMEWYGGRSLLYKPKHFLKANAPVKTRTQEIWISENCSGRYYLETLDDDDFFLSEKVLVYFEDAGDLVYYDLVWA